MEKDYEQLNQEVDQLLSQPPLLPDFDELPPLAHDAPPMNSADIAYKLRAIKALKAEIAQYEQQKKEAVLFYDQRVQAREERIEYLLAMIGNWLNQQQLPKLATPNGTVYFTTRTKALYGENMDELVAWCKTHNIPVRESPNLREVASYIEKTGEVPPGYSAEPVTTLAVR